MMQEKIGTGQLFAEAGYSVKSEWLKLEPFANLAYVNFESNGIAESGGAAAWRGDKQHTDATMSTLALTRDTGLRFNGGNTPYAMTSVPVSRDGIVLKAGAELAVNKNTSLSLGYGGLLSKSHQDNSVNAGFSWRF